VYDALVHFLFGDFRWVQVGVDALVALQGFELVGLRFACFDFGLVGCLFAD